MYGGAATEPPHTASRALPRPALRGPLAARAFCGQLGPAESHCDHHKIKKYVMSRGEVPGSREISNNSELNLNQTPFFIKHSYIWFYSGFPQRGGREDMMKQTWNLVKGKYV